MLRFDHVEEKQHQNDGGENRYRVENAAEALPALPLRVEKDLAIHPLKAYRNRVERVRAAEFA
jgi:hypothetical protein